MYEFLIPIISFLGISVGIFLKKRAREEIKFGKFGSKYFVWMKRIILLLIILTVLYPANNIPLLIISIVIGFVVAIFINEYLFLGTSLVIGFLNPKEILILLSSLVFLYGLPYGSMLQRIKKEQFFLIILFFIPLLLLLTNLDQNLLIGFITGGLFNYLVRK